MIIRGIGSGMIGIELLRQQGQRMLRRPLPVGSGGQVQAATDIG
jgi:hypothetical protein